MKRKIRMTVQNLIDELYKIDEKGLKVCLVDSEEGAFAIRDMAVCHDKFEDPKDVFSLKFMESDNYIRDSMTVAELIGTLESKINEGLDRELFVIIGWSEAGRFIQNVSKETYTDVKTGESKDIVCIDDIVSDF